MLPPSIHQPVVRFLSNRKGVPVEILSENPLSGGSINKAFHLKTDSGDYFLKYNSASKFPQMFEKEARGLTLLRSANAVDIPEVLHYGEAGDDAFLLLEFVESGTETKDFWEDFGKSLALLHQHHAGRFGLDHDNYMGSLYQHNNYHDDWTGFFIEERLQRQIKPARERGALTRSDVSAFERLYRRLDEMIPETLPSLVHGDLWSGNFMVNSHGKACLIDPAVYYGHPETDIAMSTLFGRFDERFYDAYTQHHALEKGWQERLDIFNLYPLMVHVNLFGQGYLPPVREVINRF
jgi:fructosamine-3-kinase